MLRPCRRRGQPKVDEGDVFEALSAAIKESENASGTLSGATAGADSF